MTRNTSIFIAMVVAILAFALTPSTASAQSYTGSWPLTVTRSTFGNGTSCLTITDDGSKGWPHSGFGTWVDNGTSYFASFQLINGLLTVTVEEPGSTGQNAGAVFSARASKGTITTGIYDQVYGGEEFDSGVVTFGTKGGC